jgi:hypothetical protein
MNQSLHPISGDILNRATTLHTVKDVLRMIMDMATLISSRCPVGKYSSSAMADDQSELIRTFGEKKGRSDRA